jgi:CO/xanthine dehydrogenase Mo-binding subunit
MAYTLIGKNFTPPDVHAKVTGKARHTPRTSAPRALAFCKLLLSPMPHARVKSVDISAALKLEGVYGVLRASDVPKFAPPQESILTDEPTFVGDPVLAWLQSTRPPAAEALEKSRSSSSRCPSRSTRCRVSIRAARMRMRRAMSSRRARRRQHRHA